MDVESNEKTRSPFRQPATPPTPTTPKAGRGRPPKGRRQLGNDQSPGKAGGGKQEM